MAKNEEIHYLKKRLDRLLTQGNPSEIGSFIDRIAEATLDGVWFWDVNNPEHEWMSPNFWRTLGYDYRKMDHKTSSWMPLVHHDDLDEMMTATQEHLLGKTPILHSVARYLTGDGRWAWIQCRGMAVRDKEGKAIGLLGFHVDISKIKELEMLLEESNKEGKIGFWSIDTLTDEVFWSAEAKRIHEVENHYEPNLPEALTFYLPEFRKTVREKLNYSIDHQITSRIEAKIKAKNGTIKDVAVLVIPQEVNGKTTKVFGTVKDNTELNRTIDKLEKSYQNFSQIFEQSSIPILLLNFDNSVRNVNESACKLFQYKKSQLIGLTSKSLFLPETRNEVEKGLAFIQDNRGKVYRGKVTHIRKDGSILYLDLSISQTYDSDNKIYALVQLLDNTELHKTQKELLDATRFQNSVLSSTLNVSIVSTGANGLINYINESGERMFGYSAEELIGKESPLIFMDPTEVNELQTKLEFKHKQKFSEAEALIHGIAQHGIVTRNCKHIHKDGTVFPVQLSISAIGDPKNPEGYVCTTTDLSHIERVAQIEEKLNEKEKLLDLTKKQNTQLKEFSQIVSRNLRSASTNIHEITKLLVLDVPDLKDTQMFQLLEKSAINLLSTISDLTSATQLKVKEQSLHSVDLSKIVKSAFNVLKSYANQNNVLCINNIPNNSPVWGNDRSIESAILQLINNAIQYSDPTKDSFVQVDFEKGNEFSKIKISDNGIGIDLDLHGHNMFKLEKTFHDKLSGKGAGLFLTKYQLEGMEAKIEVESIPQKGSTFTITMKNK